MCCVNPLFTRIRHSLFMPEWRRAGQGGRTAECISIGIDWLLIFYGRLDIFYALPKMLCADQVIECVLVRTMLMDPRLKCVCVSRKLERRVYFIDWHVSVRSWVWFMVVVLIELLLFFLLLAREIVKSKLGSVNLIGDDGFALLSVCFCLVLVFSFSS